MDQDPFYDTDPLFDVVDVLLPLYLAATAISSGAYDRLLHLRGGSKRRRYHWLLDTRNASPSDSSGRPQPGRMPSRSGGPGPSRRPTFGAGDGPDLGAESGLEERKDQLTAGFADRNVVFADRRSRVSVITERGFRGSRTEDPGCLIFRSNWFQPQPEITARNIREVAVSKWSTAPIQDSVRAAPSRCRARETMPL